MEPEGSGSGDDGVVVLTSGDSSLLEEGGESDQSGSNTSESPSLTEEEEEEEFVLEEITEYSPREIADEKLIDNAAAGEGFGLVSALKRERLVEGDDCDEEINSCKITKLLDDNDDDDSKTAFYYRRLHKLETDRRNLREQLLVAKENLLYCECSLAEAEGRLVSVSHDHDKIIKTLKTELLEATMNKDELLAENGRLILRLSEACVDEDLLTSTQSQLENCRIQLCMAREKLKKYEGSDIQLIKADRAIQVLEKKLHAVMSDQKTVSVLKKQLDSYEGVVCRNEILEQENAALRQRVGNLDLLRYQLQTERDKCATLEERLTVSDQMKGGQHEIKCASEKDDRSVSSSSLVLLKYKLLDAQQREVILTKKCGEMETEVKVAKRETRSIQERNAELQKLLTIEKEEIKIKNDAIQRLERRLIFITKEREGCVNVLNSYKLDAGVELVLKEQIKELQATLKRYEGNMEELEQKNNELVKNLATETRKVFLISQEGASLQERMSMIREECGRLSQDKQKLEDLLMKT